MVSTMALAALASMELVEGFATTTNIISRGLPQQQQRRKTNNSRSLSSSSFSPLRMASDAQAEIAKLKEMAAKARAEAAALAKVRRKGL
jgi:hypothetical protein